MKCAICNGQERRQRAYVLRIGATPPTLKSAMVCKGCARLLGVLIVPVLDFVKTRKPVS